MFARALLALFTGTAVAANFIDVKAGHTFYDAITYWSEKGVIQGYPDGHAKMYRTVNRAETVKMVMGAMGVEASGSTATGFPDVPSSAWYAPYVAAAKAKGLIAGYPDGTFKGEQPVTFAELAKIVARSQGFESEGTADVWYRPYLTYLSDHHAIPTTVVSLSAPAIRGELAESLFRLKTGKTDKPSLSVSAVEKSTASANSAPAGGPSGNYALLDTFDDANMNGWTVVDAGEIDIPSMWTVRTVGEIPDGQPRTFLSPRLVQFENTYNKDSTIESGRLGTYAYWSGSSTQNWSDYTFSAIVNSPDDDGIGVLFHYKDAKNYDKLELDSQRKFAKLFVVRNGTETEVAKTEHAYAMNTDLTVSVTVKGGSITASVDGKDLFGSVKEPSPISGSVGLYCWGSMGVGFDDVKVTAR